MVLVFTPLDYGNNWVSDTTNTDINFKQVQMFSMDNGYILGNTYNQGVMIFSKNNLNDITNTDTEQFNIYPNPTSDFIYTNINSKTTIESIDIYNAYGKKVFANNLNLKK